MNALRRQWPRPRDIRGQTQTLAAPGADGTARSPSLTAPRDPKRVFASPRRRRGEGKGEGPHARSDQLTTMLTIFPGTTITLRTVLPSRCLATLGTASAFSRTSASAASRVTSTLARSLPFT
jgi:hypothetical protein